MSNIIRQLFDLSSRTSYSELEDGTCLSYDEVTHEQEIIPDGFEAVEKYAKGFQEECYAQKQELAQMRQEVSHDIYGYPFEVQNG